MSANETSIRHPLLKGKKDFRETSIFIGAIFSLLLTNSIYFLSQGWGESGLNCWGVRMSALVLFLFYAKVSGMRPVLLVLPAFNDTGSLVGWHIPLVPPWVTASRFLAGNRETELNPITFSSLLLFRVFLSFLFS